MMEVRRRHDLLEAYTDGAEALAKCPVNRSVLLSNQEY